MFSLSTVRHGKALGTVFSLVYHDYFGDFTGVISYEIMVYLIIHLEP